jgi:hypothetical protein
MTMMVVVVMMMQDSKTQFCCSKFPWSYKRIFAKITDNLSTRSQKGSPALPYSIQTTSSGKNV